MAKRYSEIRTSDGTTVCERCLVAEGPLLRMRGLLGRSGLPDDEGILLRPWRMASRRRAHSVLELPAGACARRGVREGDRLELAA